MSAPPDPSRRSETAHRAIIEAVTQLVAEQGYDTVSVEAIARRAGVGKQTIYRWWPSKAAVALEALRDGFSTVTGFPDTGDVIADMRTQMTGVNESLSTTGAGPLCRALIAAAQSDPSISQAHLDEIIEPASVECRARLRRAQQQGQIRADVDVQTTIDLLYGAIYYRLLLATRPSTREQIDAALDIVFEGLRPHGGTSRA